MNYFLKKTIPVLVLLFILFSFVYFFDIEKSVPNINSQDQEIFHFKDFDEIKNIAQNFLIRPLDNIFEFAKIEESLAQGETCAGILFTNQQQYQDFVDKRIVCPGEDLPPPEDQQPNYPKVCCPPSYKPLTHIGNHYFGCISLTPEGLTCPAKCVNYETEADCHMYPKVTNRCGNTYDDISVPIFYTCKLEFDYQDTDGQIYRAFFSGCVGPGLDTLECNSSGTLCRDQGYRILGSAGCAYVFEKGELYIGGTLPGTPPPNCEENPNLPGCNPPDCLINPNDPRCINCLLDIGLRVQEQSSISKISVYNPDPVGGASCPVSPLKIAKDGKVYSVVLVDQSNPLASKIKVSIGNNQVLNLMKYPY
jgi:hypothetical protein